MKTFLLQTLTGINVVSFDETDLENQGGIYTIANGMLCRELQEGESTLALRYGLNPEGKVIIDRFETKTDAEVLALVEAETKAKHEESVAFDKANFKLAPNDFLRFLGGQRRIGIRMLAKEGDPVAEDMLDMFNRVEFISSTDPDLKASLLYLESKPGFAGIHDEFFDTGYTFQS